MANIGACASDSRAPSRADDATAFTVFLLGTFLLWLTAPHNGEFWWSDSPRHALNGVFIKDLVVATPWRDPASWAMQYYFQYPALTILFYPPLFYVVSAPFYALFGVSHATGLFVVFLHYFAAAFGLYRLAGRYTSAPVAIAIGLLLMAAPGLALWGRQVMLEIPSLALAIWAIVVLRDYGDNNRHSLLYLGAFLLLCAVYTKITAIFLAPAIGLMLLESRGRSLWRDRSIWVTAIFFVIGLIPLAVITLEFGQANVQSVVGIADSEASRATLAGWTWYARQLPSQLGWPLLATALLCPILAAFGPQVRSLRRADVALLLAWFVVGYLFFSAIDLKEARHSTLILPPLLIAAGLTLEQLSKRWAAALAVILVTATAFETWRTEPVPMVSGYREAAELVQHQAPPNSIILFSGKRDGSFVFNLRTLDPQRRLFTIRSDKLLLNVAVRRELGVNEKPFTEEEISQMLDNYGISYVVAQSDFWTDLPVMSRLQTVLRSDQFAELARIPVVSNVPTEDKEVRIYRNLHPIRAGRTLRLDLPMIGTSVEGITGAQPQDR